MTKFVGNTFTRESDSTNVFSEGALIFIFQNGGSALTTGVKGDIQCPYNGTITKCTLLADQTGSITIDIWKDTAANYPPTVADTITASNKPAFSSNSYVQNTSLTSWNKTITAGDVLRFNIDSVSTITQCSLILNIRKT